MYKLCINPYTHNPAVNLIFGSALSAWFRISCVHFTVGLLTTLPLYSLSPPLLFSVSVSLYSLLLDRFISRLCLYICLFVYSFLVNPLSTLLCPPRFPLIFFSLLHVSWSLFLPLFLCFLSVTLCYFASLFATSATLLFCFSSLPLMTTFPTVSPFGIDGNTLPLLAF